MIFTRNNKKPFARRVRKNVNNVNFDASSNNFRFHACNFKATPKPIKSSSSTLSRWAPNREVGMSKTDKK